MIKKLFLIISLLLSLNSFAADSNVKEAEIKQGVTKALNNSIACWNSADLRCFMDSYVRGKDTVYITGTEVLHGFQQFYDNFQKKFASGKNGSGNLEIKIMEIIPLDNNHAFLYGRWKLTNDNKVYTGVTSMLFVKNNARWQIMVNHSNE